MTMFILATAYLTLVALFIGLADRTPVGGRIRYLLGHLADDHGHLKAVKANFEARQKVIEELRSIDETAEGRAYDEDEAAKVEELRSNLAAIDERVRTGIEQEIRSIEITDATASLLGAIEARGSGELVDERTIGERFESEAEFDSRGLGGVYDQKLDFRAVTDVTLGAASGGALTQPQRLARIGNDFLDRRVFLIDELPSIPVGQGAVEYVQDKTPLADLANKPTEVDEGAAKPQAGPTLDVVTEPTPTIAAWVNLTRQVLADVPQVRGYLDTKLRYALKRRADAQVVNGSGSGNIVGLAQRSGILTHAPGSAEKRYLSIRRGIRLMEDAESVPEFIVLNPSDAELFDISNHGDAALHAVPNVAGPSARTAWGLRQVRSTAIAAGTALLVDPMAVAVLDRQSVNAYLTDSHAENFTKNILTLLLEMRVGLALFDPKGVLKVTFNGTT